MSAARIAAERVVAAHPSAVFAFLADLENHWLLADRFIEVVTLDRPGDGGPAQGGTVRMRGPLGLLRRTARTQVVDAQPPVAMEGVADVGGTSAQVRWTLTPLTDATRVRLEAHVTRAAAFDRLLLAAGGRRWLRRRFESILETLAERLRGGPQRSSA